MNYDSVPLRDFKELNDWETVIFVYQSALKQIETKINILNGEFQHRHKYNPIEHVKIQDQNSGEHCKEIETTWI